MCAGWKDSTEDISRCPVPVALGTPSPGDSEREVREEGMGAWGEGCETGDPRASAPKSQQLPGTGSCRG